MIVSVAVSSQVALADPALNYVVAGSSVLIFARNDEAVSYNCDIRYQIAYTQYGEAGTKEYAASFGSMAHTNQLVVRTDTTYAGSSLEPSEIARSCRRINTNPPPPPGIERPVCPAGLTFIGRLYGEKESGGSAFLKIGRLKFPADFKLSHNYRQKSAVQTTYGGAKSPWDGISGIPDGIFLSAEGDHYWSVGVDAEGQDGRPDITFDRDGNARQFNIGMYCGPAGWPGPGCHVSVTVCARRDE
ncbi:hypothetical protein ACOTWZ_11930 [Burkholderia glumae]